VAHHVSGRLQLEHQVLNPPPRLIPAQHVRKEVGLLGQDECAQVTEIGVIDRVRPTTLVPLSVVLSVVSEKMAVYEGVTALPSIRPMAQAAA